MTDLLDDEQGDAQVRERLDSGDWWVIVAPLTHHVFSIVERAHYMGDANVDFELLIDPRERVAFAHKRRMGRVELAALVGVDLPEGRDLLIIEDVEPSPNTGARTL